MANENLNSAGSKVAPPKVLFRQWMLFHANGMQMHECMNAKWLAGIGQFHLYFIVLIQFYFAIYFGFFWTLGTSSQVKMEVSERAINYQKSKQLNTDANSSK